MEIRPIETVYNGYRFRSRLEARWAVFFDVAGIKYQYEPEGFSVKPYGDDDETEYKYLPDFYLPDYGYYCEVKPSKTKLYEEQEKLSWMIDWSGPLADGLMILGQIPVFKDDGFILPKFVFYKWNKGIDSYLASFVLNDWYGAHKINIILEDYGASNGAPSLPDTCIGEDLYMNSRTTSAWIDGLYWVLQDNYVRNSAWTVNAWFDLARQARFEHGETPNAKK